jgi:hypothetical protein
MKSGVIARRAPISGLPEIGKLICASRAGPTCVRAEAISVRVAGDCFASLAMTMDGLEFVDAD